MAPGTSMRVITLMATNREAISDCRAIIGGMVMERMMASGGQPSMLSLGVAAGLEFRDSGGGGLGMMMGGNAAVQTVSCSMRSTSKQMPGLRH